MTGLPLDSTKNTCEESLPPYMPCHTSFFAQALTTSSQTRNQAISTSRRPRIDDFKLISQQENNEHNLVRFGTRAMASSSVMSTESADAPLRTYRVSVYEKKKKLRQPQRKKKKNKKKKKNCSRGNPDRGQRRLSRPRRPNEDQESMAVCTTLGSSGPPSSSPGLISSCATLSSVSENLSGTLSEVEVQLREDSIISGEGYLQSGMRIWMHVPIMFQDSMVMMALNTAGNTAASSRHECPARLQPQQDLQGEPASFLSSLLNPAASD